MITNIKEFQNKLNEELSILNSDKEVKLKNYQALINDFNSKKNSLKNVFAKPQDKWEDEAAKIILGNTYLGFQWKLSKIQNNIDTDTDKFNSTDLTQEEKKSIQLEISDNKKKLSEEQNDLNNKIRKDLIDIQSL